MLQSIRSQAGSWFIKFLLAGIIASFALWGISDIIRGYGSNKPVATIGKAHITLDEFSDAFRKALSNLQQMTKKIVTPEQIKQMNIPKQVLDSMIYKAALDQDIKELGLKASDTIIRQEIQAIPAFLTKDKTFDRNAFAQILRAQGLSEGKFVGEIRSELQQHQLFEGLSQGLGFSDEYIVTLNKALEQPFQFISVEIPLSKMVINKAITDNEVLNFYNANNEKFRQPEFRTVIMLRFEKDALRAKIVVSDNEIKEEYEKRIQDYSSEEKRSAQQVTFETDAQARKAYEMFQKGKSLKDLAKELKSKFKEIPGLTKAQFSSEHAEKVFSMTPGAPEVVQTDKGWMLFVITKVDPARVQSFEEVRGDLKNKLIDERFNEFVEQLQNQVEDALSGGAAMQEIAKKHSLGIEVVSNVDKAGNDSEGKAKIDPAIAHDVLEFAFANPKDADSNLILARGNDSKLVGVIARVDSTRDSRIPPLDEIKVKVTGALKADMQNKLASAMAKDIAKEGKSADTLRKAASQRSLSSTNLPPLSRATVDKNKELKDDLSHDTIEKIFALSVGENLITPTKTGFKVIMMEKFLPYTPDSQKLTKFKEVMGQMVKKDFKEIYRGYLLSKYPTTINQSQVDHVVGN